MNHTVSLELSKQLKEKGFPQNLENYWCLVYENEEQVIRKYEASKYDILCSAPLLSEVLEQLPDDVIFTTDFDDDKKLYEAGYSFGTSYKPQVLIFKDANPCDAAAKLWLQLKQEGIIK